MRGPLFPFGKTWITGFQKGVCYACGSPGRIGAADPMAQAPNRHRAWDTPVSAFGVSMKSRFHRRAGASLGQFCFCYSPVLKVRAVLSAGRNSAKKNVTDKHSSTGGATACFCMLRFFVSCVFLCVQAGALPKNALLKKHSCACVSYRSFLVGD